MILPCPLIHFCNYAQGGEENKTVIQLVWKIDAEYWLSSWTLWTVWEKMWERLTQEKTNKKILVLHCVIATHFHSNTCASCVLTLGATLTNAKKKMLFLEYFKCLLLQYTKTISILDKSKSVYTSWVSLSCSLCLSLSSLQKSVSARMEVFASMQMAPVNVPQVSLDSTVSLVCPYRNCKQCSSKLWLLVECF